MPAAIKAACLAYLAAALMLCCCSATARAQAQAYPPGLFDDVMAVANMPGAVSSFSGSGGPGQAPYTRTYGANGWGGNSAMASASSNYGGQTMTSTTINGVTTTNYNGGVGAAYAPQQTIASTAGGVGGVGAMASASSYNGVGVGGSGSTMASTTVDGKNGGGGSTMASTTVNGGGGSTMTSTTVDGVTKTTVSGVSAGGAGEVCTSVYSTNGQSCDGPSGKCCAITADVKRCSSFTAATATVNGAFGRCCITLLRASNKRPAMFCAGPASPAYYPLPASADVTLKPMCKSLRDSNPAGSLACIVRLPSLMPGFVAPSGYTTQKPLIFNKGAGFSPCMSSAYSRVLQTSSVRGGEVVITSKCE